MFPVSNLIHTKDNNNIIVDASKSIHTKDNNNIRMDVSDAYLKGIFKGKKGREVTVQMTLNGGSMTKHVMSIKCAMRLGLPVKYSESSIVTLNGKEETTLGEFGPISFRIETLHETIVRESFVVIKGLIRDIILSSNLLSSKLPIDCRVSPCGRFVKVDSSKMSSFHIYPENIEPGKCSAENSHRYCELLSGANTRSQQINLSATDTIVIPANGIASVHASFTRANNDEQNGFGYYYSRDFGKLDVLILEEICFLQSNGTTISVANFESNEITIHKGSNLGYVLEVNSSITKSMIKNNYPPLSISGRKITFANADLPADKNEFIDCKPVQIKATSSRSPAGPLRVKAQPYGLSLSPFNLCRLTSEIYNLHPKCYIRLIIYDSNTDGSNSFRYRKPSRLLVSHFETN